jgi:hypothetical protein
MLLRGLAGGKGVDDGIYGLLLTMSVVLVAFVECPLAVALYFVYFLGRLADILVDTDDITIPVVNLLLFLEEMLPVEDLDLRCHLLREIALVV